MTTTYSAIRDGFVTAIRNLTPARFATQPFRRYIDQVEFASWAEANPGAAFRVFDISTPHDITLPEVSNTDVEDIEQTLNVDIAYPHHHAKYGEFNRDDMDSIIESDQEKVDDAIGLNGAGNYQTGQHASILESAVSIPLENVTILAMQYKLQFRRTRG